MAGKILGAIALLTIVLLIAILVMLVNESLPFFYTNSVFDFLFSDQWHPVADPPQFGILSLIWASLYITFISMIGALPFGIGTALYLHSVASKSVREILKPIIELLGSVPSVVYGLFGMTFLAPVAQKLLNLTVGQCAAVAGVTLGIMVIPIVTSVTEDALNAVPKSLFEAALSLGSTRWEATMKVILPAARSGIIGAVLLSIGRSIGETMVVLMVAGGATKISLSPFAPMRPMTATIAAEMGETPLGTAHFHALFAIAVVLFIITLIINLLANKYAFGNKK